jgi:ribosomal protein S18 acetylase RimI-like enzyme
MQLPVGFTIRRASTGDIEILANHRQEMFRDMGYTDDAALESMSLKFRSWLLAKMNSGKYHAWVAAAPDAFVVAGAGLWLMDWPPHIVGIGPRRGNILNVYTLPRFRRRGLARCLTQTVVEWCRGNAVDTVVLHASGEGRPLYQSLGFIPSNEMQLKL